VKLAPFGLASAPAQTTPQFPPGNTRTESRPIFSGTLRLGATPPSRKLSAPARFAILLVRLREVSLLFHHRRILMNDRVPHFQRRRTSGRADTRPRRHQTGFVATGVSFTIVGGQECPPHNFLWPGNRRSRKGLRPEVSNLTTCSKNKLSYPRSIRGQSPLALSS